MSWGYLPAVAGGARAAAGPQMTMKAALLRCAGGEANKEAP
ncbi:hypothetical protein [Streptomyces albospinus]|nr:hypothetical protein [Streptomyces albospinus]